MVHTRCLGLGWRERASAGAVGTRNGLPPKHF